MFAIASQSVIAYEKIKDMIFHMELLPGTRFSELQIAENLHISRTPVHNALLQLNAEGLVVINPNSGVSVTEFSQEEIQEIGTVRLMQDILSAELAAYYGCNADFDRLAQFAEHCETVAAKGDIYNRIQTDKLFHLEITKISGNKKLMAQQVSIYQQIHLIQISQYTDIQQSLIQIHHHQPMVEALRNADLDKLRQLICDHNKDFFRLEPYLLNCYCCNSIAK